MRRRLIRLLLTRTLFVCVALESGKNAVDSIYVGTPMGCRSIRSLFTQIHSLRCVASEEDNMDCLRRNCHVVIGQLVSCLLRSFARVLRRVKKERKKKIV